MREGDGILVSWTIDVFVWILLRFYTCVPSWDAEGLDILRTHELRLGS